MPRTARKKSETGIYHIMLRGMDRRALFTDDEDCERFIETLKRVKELSKFQLFSYCLMGNHVHLLLREGEEPLELVFKRLGVSYVYYYNWKYQLQGHLFQDRFRSEPVDDDAYFMDVLRYICQNPIKAGLSENVTDYPWVRCSRIHKAVELDDISALTDLEGSRLLSFVSEPCAGEHLDEKLKLRFPTAMRRNTCALPAAAATFRKSAAGRARKGTQLSGESTNLGFLSDSSAASPAFPRQLSNGC